jgi:hypothetical protein
VTAVSRGPGAPRCLTRSPSCALVRAGHRGRRRGRVPRHGAGARAGASPSRSSRRARAIPPRPGSITTRRA